MNSLLEMSLSRRTLIKTSATLTAGCALGARGFAAEPLPLITKRIPATGEELPVIGLGTNAYSVTAPEEVAMRKEVLAHMPKLGGKIIDTARAYGESEVVIGRLLKELGTRKQMFLATKTPNQGSVTPAAATIEESFKRLQTDYLDLLQIHSLHGVEELLPAMREWKQAGKIRYLGITTSSDDQYPALQQVLRKHPFDFVQVDYSIDNRGAEEHIFPIAQDRGLAVLINVPLGGRRGNLLSRLSGKPLPAFATDLDVSSWAQLLLKYNVSHPVVTAVIPGTTKVTHLRDNQLAGRGRLPSPEQRKRIEDYWASLNV